MCKYSTKIVTKPTWGSASVLKPVDENEPELRHCTWFSNISVYNKKMLKAHW